MYEEAPLGPWDARISGDFDFDVDVDFVRVIENELL
jgi:hypothetical protein